MPSVRPRPDRQTLNNKMKMKMELRAGHIHMTFILMEETSLMILCGRSGGVRHPGFDFRAAKEEINSDGIEKVSLNSVFNFMGLPQFMSLHGLPPPQPDSSDGKKEYCKWDGCQLNSFPLPSSPRYKTACQRGKK